MHPHAELLEDFYAAFARRDGAAMAAAYAADATFSDPVFRDLRGPQVGGMWRMLCERGTDLVVTYRDLRADDAGGSAHWEATYTFTATGRKVHNVIDASFTFREGRIATHVDRFDLRRWMGMALGPAGALLGWLPPLQDTLRKRAGRELEKYLARR